MNKQDEIRFKKFQESKLGRLIDLAQNVEAGSHPYPTKAFRPCEPKSALSSALWIVSKGTRYEQDAKAIITILCPEFFQD